MGATQAVGSIAKIASLCAPVPMVNSVAKTPIFFSLLAAKTNSAPLDIPTISNLCSFLSVSTPSTVSVLQATTTNFTLFSSKKHNICSTKARTSSSLRGPYGVRAVSPK